MAAYTAIDDAGSFFNTVLYTGNGSTQSITGAGFQPDFVWGKQRTDAGANWFMFDSPRGVAQLLESDTTAVPDTDATSLTAFDSDGFTLGAYAQSNENTKTMVSYNWKGGTTTGIATNGSTTITPNAYSFNQTAGISILKFTGNQVNGAKLAHGLGVVPEMVFFKTLETASTWGGYNKTITATDYIKLDSTAAATSYALAFDDTEPDAVNITLGSWEAVNGNVGMEEMIAYAFASVQGYSKISSYTGNGNADGPFVYTGFRPAYLLIKKTNATNDWLVYDNKRLGYNVGNSYLLPNTTTAEGTDTYLDILSNGFKLRSGSHYTNTSAGTYIFTAFAESPLVNSEGVPTNAR